MSGESANFSIWELILFVVIGCLGGLIGAVFNAANEHLTIWRMKRINFSKSRRLIEVIAISSLCSFVAFLMPLLWNKCTDLPTDMQDWSNQEKNLVDALVPFMCPEGQYNEVASLIFTEPDIAIKQLFHFREAGADDTSTFSSGALFVFFVPYISLATITYGIAGESRCPSSLIDYTSQVELSLTFLITVLQYRRVYLCRPSFPAPPLVDSLGICCTNWTTPVELLQTLERML